MRDAPQEAVREAALKMLERRRRTRSDLARRLRDKGFDATEIDAVLDRLIAVGLVNDLEYARVYLESRWGRRASGWRRLEQDLRGRGITAADIAAARAGFDSSERPASEVELARRVITQSARRMAALDASTRRRRLYALLVRRGFDSDAIREALASHAREAAAAV
ncbi:MAG: regulatory protein RecX [Candidatus Eisenbacteria bacterium]|uniref:Regulatory protein RecX n=1 Tax=Eiseniibacteriota bacterium TaxID=2212470 RepID=A0A849T1R8_UNCEI|nr:regulatory protein RecX [Candidatus Eisenbacteria bacterium]